METARADLDRWVHTPKQIQGLQERAFKWFQEFQVCKLWGLFIKVIIALSTCSSILAWEVPWTEGPGSYSPRGHKRVGQDLATKQQQGVEPDHFEGPFQESLILQGSWRDGHGPGNLCHRSQRQRGGRSFGSTWVPAAVHRLSPDAWIPTHPQAPPSSLPEGQSLCPSPLSPVFSPPLRILVFKGHISFMFFLVLQRWWSWRSSDSRNPGHTRFSPAASFSYSLGLWPGLQDKYLM